MSIQGMRTGLILVLISTISFSAIGYFISWWAAVAIWACSFGVLLIFMGRATEYPNIDDIERAGLSPKERDVRQGWW